MAKLNYDRDVKGLEKSVNTDYQKLCNKEVKVHEGIDKWELWIGGENTYIGTLREVYCQLLGMSRVLKNM